MTASPFFGPTLVIKRYYFGGKTPFKIRYFPSYVRLLYTLLNWFNVSLEYDIRSIQVYTQYVHSNVVEKDHFVSGLLLENIESRALPFKETEKKRIKKKEKSIERRRGGGGKKKGSMRE